MIALLGKEEPDALIFTVSDNGVGFRKPFCSCSGKVRRIILMIPKRKAVSAF